MAIKVNYAPSDEAMKGAVDTAKHYLFEAEKIIDERFGVGYALAHPKLVGDFMKTAAMDFATSVIGQRLQDLGEYIGDLKKSGD